MRKLLLLLALALALTAGCKKATNKAAKDAPPAQTGGAGDGPGVHAPTGVVVNPGGGGGSGGAVQAVRKAVGRTVNQNEMNNLRLFIESAASGGPLPTAAEITTALQKDAPQTYKLIHEKAIVLTGATSREAIWAYTADPQTVGGEHLIVTGSGIERMTGPALQQRLQQQGP